jgi:Transposase DDE domain
MPAYTLYTWIARHLGIRPRLERVCVSYLLFLMVTTTKHSLEEAARFSAMNKSQFSKYLKVHHQTSVYTLESLSKTQTRRLSKSLRACKGLPWKIVIIIDATLQSRSSLRPENTKRFNHGQGFVIGHQWTNIILMINEILIPLPPIAFYSKSYCLKKGVTYLSEHDRVVEYLSNLNLEDYIGSHDSRDVVVLADSGYDNKHIEKTISDKKWMFIIALKKTRSVKSEHLYATTLKSKQWSQIAQFFRNQRRLKWNTIRLMTNGKKSKRMEFRIRHTRGYLRYVGQVQLVCSEPRKRPQGRRRYFACNDMRVTARQIMLGYRLRWAVELFHKSVKQNLGFEEVSTSGFDSVISHVHWVYCAYILLNLSPPGVSNEPKSLGDKQRQLRTYLEAKEKRRILQKLTRFGGVEKFKAEIRQALGDV